MSRLGLEIEAEAPGSRARAARFRTLHGEVRTPVFMPVGTQATVRAQTLETLVQSGSQVLLANTYHLMLRPGPEVFSKLGGIHSFMKWNRSVLTDSGGYQIFSLPRHRKMGEEGAEFTSHLDGRRILFTPELSIQIQKAIGSDIMMVLDQCVPSTSDERTAREAMAITHRWARRSLAARGDSPQALFGIVQGACFPELRRESASRIGELPLDGFAIGGLAVGESKLEREDITELAAELLPRDRPRYLMGVGTPLDLLEAVHRGVDMFDCILPTAWAQHGVAFTSRGQLQMRRSAYRLSEEALDPACDCPTCRTHSRAYLHHLIKAKEILGWQLLGAHNLYFYHRLTTRMRSEILAGTFSGFLSEQRELLQLRDDGNPAARAPAAGSRLTTRPSKRRGDYEVHVALEGFSSIRQISSGEIMHSVNAPEEEARSLYVEQSRLREKVRSPAGHSAPELVIWDVGLGAASNAMAAVRALEQEASLDRPVHLVSFEVDLDSLRLAAAHAGMFPHLQHPAPHLLLEQQQWRSKHAPLRWSLVVGDFASTLEGAPPPEVVFYDPFSTRTDGALWTYACLRRVLEAARGGSLELYTYSASTAVRAALLAAGFYVGRGVGSGPKQETTLALTPDLAPARAESLLDRDWLQRWERSSARFPSELSPEEVAGFERRIRAHPQFQLRSGAQIR